ncbi:hypothetical protein C8Q75DRAFT_736617 [Abortiporus biennis]|nr:hypothetical protein C8Q75DRAFT_736617 [Abortiporus biennis]
MSHAEIVEGFWVDFFHAASYFSVVALAVYDCCITFDREVEHIWKRRSNVSTVIFVVVRYANLYNLIGNTALQFLPPTRSSILYHSNYEYHRLNEFSLLAFFVLRTWAIWGQHVLPILVLTPLGIGVIILNGVPLHFGHHMEVADATTALSITLSFLVMCGTLVKTLTLKRAAKRAGVKGTLITLLIRDGTTYLCLTFILSLLQAIAVNIQSRVAGIVVIVGPTNSLRPIIVSRMILDLKSMDRVSMASLSHLHSSRFSSVHFVGNIGAPLNTTLMGQPEGEDVFTNSDGTVTFVSAKQVIENPLSIGLLDGYYKPDYEVTRQPRQPTSIPEIEIQGAEV